MFDCYIYLFAFLYSIEDPTHPYIISDNEISYSPLIYKISTEDRSIKDALFNLIDSCINKQPKNIKTFFIDAEIEDKTIKLYYSCLLPINSKIHCGYKTAVFSVIENPLVRKALTYV